MSWVETWLDAAHTSFGPDFNTCQVAAQRAGAQGFNAYLGGRYLYGTPWPVDLVAALSAAGYGVFGTWVSLRPGEGGYNTGFQDGQDCLAAAQSYPQIALVTYDVEPATWNASQSAVTAAILGFRDAVQASGRPAMIYGLQATLRAAANYDRYWATRDLPGNDPGASLGVPGSRALQYTEQAIAGLSWDLSHSEFSLLAGRGGPPPVVGGGTSLVIGHPTIVGRIDWIGLGQDGRIWHIWNRNDNLGGLLATSHHAELVDQTFIAAPGTLGASWFTSTDLNRYLLVEACGTDGVVFMAALPEAGGQPIGLTPLQGGAGGWVSKIPAGPGPAGPPGPSGPDTALRTALHTGLPT